MDDAVVAREPIDHHVRVAAGSDLGTSFFLEAGAGTGKTRILVDRVVEIINRGAAEIHEVVVITFTEKAAGELRSRIRDRLHEEYVAAEEPERTRFRAALRNLASAHVETIHAFASSLLREHPLEVGVDPSFRQLDEIGNEVDFQERWTDWLWSIDGNELQAVERCLELGMSLPTVREVARSLERVREVGGSNAATSPSPSRPPPPTASELRDQLSVLMAAADEIAAHCRNSADRAYQSALELRGQLTALPAADAPGERALETALREVRFRVYKGRAGNWTDAEHRERFLEVLQEACAQLEQYRDALNQAALTDLIDVLRRFVSEAADGRRRQGRLNFEDLLIDARALVVANPSVRRELQHRFRFMLVDEFQDTDPLQAELVFLLAAREEATAAGEAQTLPDWRLATLQPGKLFVVGDPKQSIYRFRRADVDTYSEARDLFSRHRRQGEPARVETIGQNFRSVPEVTSWVNATFTSVIAPDPQYPNAQSDYRDILAHRPGGGGGSVILLYPRVGVWDAKLPDLRREEAEAIARLITAMVDNPKWQIGAPAAGGVEHPRRIELRDICILADSRTASDLYTRALRRRNVPYILDGGREFFQRQEVRDLAAMLRALDDPSDEVSLAAALRSAAFSCSDVELLQYRQRGGRFNLLSVPVAGTPVGDAIARLRRLYDAKAHVPLPQLVDRTIRESQLAEPLLLTDSSGQRAANLKLIVARAAEFAADEVDSLRPFIRWLSERQIEGAQESESQLAESDDDVVRIMTFHGAKGLEFPVVILAKLSGAAGSGREQRIVDRQRGTVELEVGNRDNRFRTPGFAAAAEREAVYQSAEQARLMYVATTRARDLLIIPVFKSEDYPGKYSYLPGLPGWVGVVERGERDAPGGARVMLDTELVERTLPAVQHPRYDADLPALWNELQGRRAHQRRQGPSFVTPSMLAADQVKQPRETEAADRSEDEKDLDAQDDTDRALGAADGAAGVAFVGSSTARSRGSLVHEVLLRCDLADAASARTWAETLCLERGLGQLAADVQEHAARVVRSPAMQRVLAARRYLREVPVAWFDRAASRYTEGYVDLVFEEADGWVIVDYKTDRVGAEVTSLLAHYRPQVDAYRQAINAGGLAVKQSGLWFSANGALHLW